MLKHITEETIREIAERADGAGKVVSLYLNLDPTLFSTPEARESQVRSLLTDAKAQLEALDSADHDQREGVKRALDRIDTELTERLPADGAGSLAVFCQEPGGMFEVLPLPRSTEPGARVNDVPWVDPLVEQIARETWCVLMLTRRTARYLRGSPDRLRELGRFESDVHRTFDAGGWSQSRFERGVQKEAQDHWNDALDELYRMWRRAPFDRLVIVAADEIWPNVEPHLHADLAQRLVDRIRMEVEHSSVEDVQERVRAIAEGFEEQQRERTLDELREARANGDRTALGSGEVLRALNERRVGTLLLDERTETVPGAVCPRCGQIELEGTECPVDGEAMEQRADVTADLIARATEQSAEVRRISLDDDLERARPVAAILRF